MAELNLVDTPTTKLLNNPIIFSSDEASQGVICSLPSEGCPGEILDECDRGSFCSKGYRPGRGRDGYHPSEIHCRCEIIDGESTYLSSSVLAFFKVVYVGCTYLHDQC